MLGRATMKTTVRNVSRIYSHGTSTYMYILGCGAKHPGDLPAKSEIALKFYIAINTAKLLFLTHFAKLLVHVHPTP